MVMVSGAIGLQKKGGRSPPPKRGRPGGGRCAAAPYKHRLAHAPGGRRPSGRAFRCVGVLGQRPKRVLLTFARTKVSPRRVGVLIKFSKKLSPPKVNTDYFTNAPPSSACKLFHEYPPAGACKSFFPRRHMTSGAVIFSIARVFSSTVAVARHRAARAAQTAWSSHFTRQFW